MDNSDLASKDVRYGMKFLLPYLLKYRKYFLIIAISMILVAVTSALSAYIFKYILNDIFIAKDEKMLVILPLVVITLFLLRGLSRFASSYLMTRIGVGVANQLRETMFFKLVDAEYTAVKGLTTGDINAVLIQTVLNIQNTIAKTIPQLIISFLTIVALIVVILYSDWRLSLYAIGIGVLIVIPVRLLGRGVKRHTSSSEVMISEMSNRINESLNHFDLVKVYNRQAYEAGLFSKFLNRYENFQVKLAKYQLLSSPFMEFFVATAIAVVIYVGGHFVIEGSMTPGDFFAFMVALMMLYAPIKNLTQNYIVLYVLNGYIERVEGVFSLPKEYLTKGVTQAEQIKSISFDTIGYSIDGRVILEDITFEIEEGDRVAIVGKSGAGKSSLISLLFGLARPSSGNIEVNGRGQEEYGIISLRREISYVNQSAGIFNTTIQENILYGDVWDAQKYAAARSKAQCDFIDQLPQADQTMAGEFGNRLSGGQRQRIALARALYKGGSLFVLDEATSALDANTESLLQQGLERTMRERTSIIIAHRLATIEMCNKVIVMEAGRVVAYGKYDEVSKSEAFRRNFMMDGGG